MQLDTLHIFFMIKFNIWLLFWKAVSFKSENSAFFTSTDGFETYHYQHYQIEVELITLLETTKIVVT